MSNLFNVAAIRRRLTRDDAAQRLRAAAALLDSCEHEPDVTRVLVTLVRAAVIVADVATCLTITVGEGTKVQRHGPYTG